MKSLTEHLWFETPHRRDYLNITDKVEALLEKSGVQEGLCLVNAMHITASVYINDAEDGLLHDYDVWLEKLDRIALVGLPSQTHPDQVNVVWHKAVSRAKESFPSRRVEHHLAKRGVEALIEPASLPVGDGHSPENDGVGLIEFPAQTREIMGKIGTRFTLRSGRGRFVVHGRGRLAPTDVGGYYFVRTG